MSKIDEFEKRIIEQGMNDEDFVEYEKLLKRVRDNFLKRQHCYTTAIRFSDEYAEQAVKLIYYGLEKFEDGWFSTYTSYLHIGHIYEKTRNYQKAYDSFLLAKEALGSERTTYIQELSKELLWMKLHIDSFSYSTELEDYYLCYLKSEGLSKSFVNSEFRVAVAKIIISLHYGKTDEAKQSLEIAKEICQPNYKGKLFNLLSRHNYVESLKSTPEVIEFLNSIKI